MVSLPLLQPCLYTHGPPDPPTTHLIFYLTAQAVCTVSPVPQRCTLHFAKRLRTVRENYRRGLIVLFLFLVLFDASVLHYLSQRSAELKIVLVVPAVAQVRNISPLLILSKGLPWQRKHLHTAKVWRAKVLQSCLMLYFTDVLRVN